jgi:hypothetical protein
MLRIGTSARRVRFWKNADWHSSLLRQLDQATRM